MHKYEEALCIWRYYICHNPKWEEQGIDDDEIEPIEETGCLEEEQSQITELKLTSYLNIAVCYLKSKDFDTGIAACDEALALDRQNVKAFYLRARCRILDVNSGVEQLRLAIEDLRAALILNPDNKPVKEQLVKV